MIYQKFMTHHKARIIIASLSLLLFSSVVFAQETTANTKTADTAQRKKAVELLESLATQITSLQSPENRARIGANIAESLWKDDENRARALFIAIEEDIKLGFQDRDISDPADGLTLRVFHKLRADTVQRIANYDAELALNFLHATTPPEEIMRVVPAEAETALELQLAKQLTTSNPDVALKLGRQSLARGFSTNLVTLLRQLHRKQRDKGVTLYREAVQKVRDANLTDDWEALVFARTLAEAITPPTADESTYRELINVLITAALANDCDKNQKTEEDDRNLYCYQIAPLLSTMQKIDPVRTRKLSHLTTPPEGGNWQSMQLGYTELQEVAEDGSIEEILALADKYPGMEMTVYSQAMMKAYSSGDSERAKKIANSYPNPENREMLLAQLGSITAEAEITEQQVTAFQKALEEVTSDRTRLMLLNEMANRIGPKNKKMALKLIEQSAGLIEAMKSPGEKSAARINLAMSYCAQGSDRGLEIVESEIPKLNELIAAAVKLDGFDTQYLRDGEWNMSANGTVGSILTSLAQNAGYFASCDFDRAVSLSSQFERNEIRMMAQVKLAQSVLAGPPTRPRNFPRQYVEYSIRSSQSVIKMRLH